MKQLLYTFTPIWGFWQMAANVETFERVRDAHQWLASLLREREEIRSDEVLSLGRRVGLSRNNLFEAKHTMGIRARQYDNADGGFWVWHWPVAEREKWLKCYPDSLQEPD